MRVSPPFYGAPPQQVGAAPSALARTRVAIRRAPHTCAHTHTDEAAGCAAVLRPSPGAADLTRPAQGMGCTRAVAWHADGLGRPSRRESHELPADHRTTVTEAAQYLTVLTVRRHPIAAGIGPGGAWCWWRTRCFVQPHPAAPMPRPHRQSWRGSCTIILRRHTARHTIVGSWRGDAGACGGMCNALGRALPPNRRHSVSSELVRDVVCAAMLAPRRHCSMGSRSAHSRVPWQRPPLFGAHPATCYIAVDCCRRWHGDAVVCACGCAAWGQHTCEHSSPPKRVTHTQPVAGTQWYFSRAHTHRAGTACEAQGRHGPHMPPPCHSGCQCWRIGMSGGG